MREEVLDFRYNLLSESRLTWLFFGSRPMNLFFCQPGSVAKEAVCYADDSPH